MVARSHGRTELVRCGRTGSGERWLSRGDGDEGLACRVECESVTSSLGVGRAGEGGNQRDERRGTGKSVQGRQALWFGQAPEKIASYAHRGVVPFFPLTTCHSRTRLSGPRLGAEWAAFELYNTPCN